MARRGLTLPELLLAMALAAGIMAGLGHMVRQVSVTTSSLETRSETQTEAWLAMFRIRSELRAATGILSMNGRQISFVHPDVTGDDQPDVVEYQWSGAAGTALTRDVNAYGAEALIEDCQSFTLSAVRASASEELLAAHEVYEPTVQYMRRQFNVDSMTPAAQIFRVSRAGAAGFWISRVRLELQPSSGSGSLSLMLRNAPSGVPAPTSIETVCRPLSQVGGNGWQDFYFALSSGLTLGNLYAVVLRPSGTAVVRAGYDHLPSGAPATPSDYFRWSSNGGSTWPGMLDLAARDLRYKVYGRYVDSSSQPMAIQNAPVAAFELRLEAGSGISRVQLDTAVHCVNSPEVLP